MAEPGATTPGPRRAAVAVHVGIPLLVSVIGLAVVVWWWYTGRPPFARHDTVTTTAVIEEVRQGPPLEDAYGPKNYPVNATVRYVVHGADVRATVRLGMCPTPPCSLARQGQTISIGYVHASRPKPSWPHPRQAGSLRWG